MDYRERSIYVPFQAKFYQFRTKQIIDRSNEEYFMVCIPDGCLDIVFIQKDGIIRIELIGTPVERKQLIVYPDAEYFGVRMQPGLILPNAEISLREAADSEIFLPQLSPDYRELSEKIFAAQDFASRVRLFEKFFLAALLRDQRHIAGGIAGQLGHRRQADGDADGIDVELFLCAGDRLEVLVHLCNDRTGDTVGSLCLDDRVGKVERNAGPCDFGRVCAVAADSRSRIDNGCHLASGLQQLEGDDESDVAGADHQNFAAGLDTLEIHHGLCGAGADDAGGIPSFERDHVLRRSGGDDDGVALVVIYDAVLLDGDLFVGVNAHDCGVEFDADAEFLGLFQEILPDPEAALLCVVFLGTEEFVDLLEQLAAGSLVLIEDDDVHAVFLCFNGCTETRRACANDDQFMPFHGLCLLFRYDAVLRLDDHAVFQRRNTGPDIRNAVDDHDAVGTAADGAEDAARLVLLCGVPVDHHAICFQSCGDGVALIPFHLSAVQGEGDFLALVVSVNDRMFLNSHEKSLPRIQ